MTRTWHGSCYACTCTTLDHNSEIARSGSPSCRCLSTGRPAFPSSLGRAATIIDDQTDDGRAGGAPYRIGARGCDRHSPAHRQGRVHVGAAGNQRRFPMRGSNDCLFSTVVPPLNLAGALNGSGPSFRAFDGIGVGCSRYPFANLIHRHQGRFQRFAKGQPRHLSASVRYVPKPKDGAERDVGTITQGLGND